MPPPELTPLTRARVSPIGRYVVGRDDSGADLDSGDLHVCHGLCPGARERSCRGPAVAGGCGSPDSVELAALAVRISSRLPRLPSFGVFVGHLDASIRVFGLEMEGGHVVVSARPLSGHVGYRTGGSDEATEPRSDEGGADWVSGSAAVIRFSKSVGSGTAGPFEEV